MSEFVRTALSFPTVVFTVAVAVAAGYWVLSTFGGFGVDVDTDVELDVDAGGGGGALDLLGLASVPPAVAFSLTAIFGWFASLVAAVLLDGAGVSGVVGVLAAIVGAVLSLVVGVLVASVAARPLARVYRSGPPPALGDVVGRTCVVRTGHVDARFGQAEVADGSGATLLIEIRCAEANDLRRGDEALIYGYDADAGRFEVMPAPSLH